MCKGAGINSSSNWSYRNRLEHHLGTESYGLFLLLISAILFSGMGCFLKLASNTGVPSTQLVFLRAVFQGTLVVVGLCTSREQISTITPDDCSNDVEKLPPQLQPQPRARARLLISIPFGSNIHEIQVVIVRGILGGCGFIMYFYSISAIPIGDAITLFSLYPIHTLFIAYFYLGEEIRLSHIFSTVASVIGATLIAGPTFLTLSDNHENNDLNSIGYVTALIGSFFGAFVIILIRKAGTLGVSTLQLLFSWSTFGVLFSLLFRYIFDALQMEMKWRIPPSHESWFYILGMCMIGSMAHFLLNYAARMAPAGLSSIVRSSDILFAYLWEVLIFGVTPMWTTILGVILVLTSLSVIAIEKWNEGKVMKKKKMTFEALRGENDYPTETTKLLHDDIGKNMLEQED